MKTPEDNFFSRPDTPMDDIDKLDLDDEEETQVKGPAVVKVMDDPEAKIEAQSHVDDSGEMKNLVEAVEKANLNSEKSLKEIKILQDNVNSLALKLQKKIPEFAKPDDVDPSDERILELRDCRTVEEIIETFDELVLEEETGTLLCEICYVEKESQGSKYPGKFDAVMEEELGEEEGNKKQNRKFINLKKSLKRHFETDIHIKNWNIWSKKMMKNGLWLKEIMKLE